eukprot:jgi/Astpho2/5699/e_gw1.00079.71.1_t
MAPNLPVIIQGLTEAWRSQQEWATPCGDVNMQLLKKHFGHAHVTCTDTSRQQEGSVRKLDMTLADYVSWWQCQAAAQKQDCLYLKDWHFAHEFSSWAAYKLPHYFREDWLNSFCDHKAAAVCGSEGAVRGQQPEPSQIASSDYRFVYLGPKGSWTALHADVLSSYSWSSQICGRKRWRLLAPKHTHLLLDTFGSCTLWLQEPGETIFVPSGWHHTVENLDDSLSINHNWLNAHNIHWGLALLKQEYAAAAAQIEDCRDTCSTDEFEGLVQRNIAANIGLNYASMAELCSFIHGRDTATLR